MSDPKFYLRAAQAGALVKGTAGNVLTIQSDGTVAGELPPSPGAVVDVAAAVVNFNHVNGLQKFVLTVPGVLPGAAVWASLNGDTTPGGELAGVQGAYCSGDDEVTVLAYYPGLVTSLDVPILIFWIPA